MSLKTNEADERAELAEDPVLEQALRNFRASVHAWSEATYGQPRPAAPVRHVSWRFAAGWALGCVLAAGSLGGVYMHHRGHQYARNLAVTPSGSAAAVPGDKPNEAVQVASAAFDERQIAQAARDLVAVQDLLATEDRRVRQDNLATGEGQADGDLLAAVNSDVERQVPQAMEPLERLMNEGELQ